MTRAVLAAAPVTYRVMTLGHIVRMTWHWLREIFCIYAVGVRFFMWEFRESNSRHPAWNGTYRLATGTGVGWGGGGGEGERG
jgi:hypothetical protein